MAAPFTFSVPAVPFPATKPIVHKIDPHGDTLLILRKPNASFAGQKEDLATAKADAEVHLCLSSKHLTLASDYFRKMMSYDWKETEPKDDYLYNVTAEDWSVEALLIVMNIIHGQTNEVPRVVDLELLAKIAVLVDYYQCRTTVQFYVESWIERLAGPLPSICGRPLTLRLFVALVFQEAETFGKLAQIVVLESDGPIDPLGLAIPEAVIAALDARRQELVSGLLGGLHKIKYQLSGLRDTCSFECSSMSLGSLIKGMNTMGVGRMPSAPFKGFSYTALQAAIKALKVPSYESVGHSRLPRSKAEYDCHGNVIRPCSLRAEIGPLLAGPPADLRLSEIPLATSVFSLSVRPASQTTEATGE